jgi:osmotically-inducible protein OsmY
MNRSIVRILALATFVMFLQPVASAASPDVVNRTEEFRSAGALIDRLQVHEISGVLIIRGRTSDRAQAEEVSRLATSLGYQRVANLVQVRVDDDQNITRAAERELTVHHSLEGCQFRVNSKRGVVSVAGRVRHELQKDVALQVLRKIDGVRSVEVNLTRF